MDALRNQLHVEGAGQFWITGLLIPGWGADITFICVYQPPDSSPSIPFRLELTDCRELHWRIYVQNLQGENRPPAEFVSIHLGTPQHRKPLNLLTDAFGLTALYGDLRIIPNEF